MLITKFVNNGDDYFNLCRCCCYVSVVIINGINVVVRSFTFPCKILMDAFRVIEVLSTGLKLVKVESETCFYLRGKSLT